MNDKEQIAKVFLKKIENLISEHQDVYYTEPRYQSLFLIFENETKLILLEKLLQKVESEKSEHRFYLLMIGELLYASQENYSLKVPFRTIVNFIIALFDMERNSPRYFDGYRLLLLFIMMHDKALFDKKITPYLQKVHHMKIKKRKIFKEKILKIAPYETEYAIFERLKEFPSELYLEIFAYRYLDFQKELFKGLCSFMYFYYATGENYCEKCVKNLYFVTELDVPKLYLFFLYLKHNSQSALYTKFLENDNIGVTAKLFFVSLISQNSENQETREITIQFTQKMIMEEYPEIIIEYYERKEADRKILFLKVAKKFWIDWENNKYMVKVTSYSKELKALEAYKDKFPFFIGKEYMNYANLFYKNSNIKTDSNYLNLLNKMIGYASEDYKKLNVVYQFEVVIG
jgi:hypothetical protein